MTPYPIVLCGDHAAFEAEWAASGKPDNERPDWPLPSFDAQDWAAAFCKIANERGFKDAKGEPIDEGWMITWFANALMRGHDEASAALRAEIERLHGHVAHRDREIARLDTLIVAEKTEIERLKATDAKMNCLAVLLHLSSLVDRWQEGPFRAGFETAIEEAAAYIEHLRALEPKP